MHVHASTNTSTNTCTHNYFNEFTMQTVFNGRGTEGTKEEEKGIEIGAPLFPIQRSLSHACPVII